MSYLKDFDIVFLVNTSAKMAICLDSIKKALKGVAYKLFIQDDTFPFKECRMRVVGYSGANVDGGIECLVNKNPFVRNINEVYAQIDSLNASDSTGEDSLLAVLYHMGTAFNPNGLPEEPFKWRGRSEAVRFVIAFTDASFSLGVHIEELGVIVGIDDIIISIENNKLRVALFAPSTDASLVLAEADRLERIDYMQYSKSGIDPIEALNKFLREDVSKFYSEISRVMDMNINCLSPGVVIEDFC